MSDACRALILEHIRQHGPLTFAAFMDIALYDPQVGYYATAFRRSGGSGDFYTSVDVGPVFGEFLARQFVEMARLLQRDRRQGAGGRRQPSGIGRQPIDLVEAGAGDGRLSRDVVDALERAAPEIYERIRLHLVERSSPARAAQRETLGRHASRLVSSMPDLPDRIHGILFANELLDAFPVHSVVWRNEGLHEIFIDVADGQLVECEATPSTPQLENYFAALGVDPPPGSRAEVNLQAIEWTRRAARILERGFLLLIDYGHEANVLYSASHASGTLATFSGHVIESRDDRRGWPWLRDPGSSDITAHVDFTTLRRTAAAEGLAPLCLVDQMHFLLSLGVEDWLQDHAGAGRADFTKRLALKTLLVPGGLGTTHHVMILARNVPDAALRGCG